MSLPIYVHVYADASARAHRCLSSFPSPCPNESPYIMPIQMHMCNAQCLVPCRCPCNFKYLWLRITSSPVTFFPMIHYLFGYSLLHMNNEWLLINHLFVIIPPMHMPITLSTPRPMPLHMPMPLPMPLLILVPLHLLTLVPSFSQNYQDCFSLPPSLQIPIDQLLSNLEHYSPFCFLVYFEYLLSHNQYLLLSLSNY